MTAPSSARRTARRVTAVLVGIALAGAATAPAGASPPQQIPVDETESFVIPLCGIDTQVTLRAVGTLMIRDRGVDGIDYYAEHLDREAVNTNIATGKSVRITQSYRGRDQRIVDNGDGTLTITFRATYTQTNRAPDGSVAFRSAGQDTVRVVVDDNGTPGDPDDDTVLVEDYLGFTGHDGLAGTDFCDWYADVTA